MDLVSIVVPAYNAEKSIKHTLESLLSQSYSHIEIVVVNDGSVDNTEYICKKIEKKDNRVKLISIGNGGVSNARNVGIENCSGKYLAFVDSDDLAEPGFIESLIKNTADDVDLIAEGYKIVNPDGKYLFSQELEQGIFESDKVYSAIEYLQEHKAFNVLWNKLFRRDVIIENQLKMDTKLSMGEDLLFIIDYLKCVNGKILILDKEDYHYTLSESGLQASFKENVNLRLEQVGKLRELYIQKNFPLDGLYFEYLRTFYTSILESAEKKKTIQTILNSNLFLELMDKKLNLGLKFTAFFKVLKTRKSCLILFFIKIINLIKKMDKKSYSWK